MAKEHLKRDTRLAPAPPPEKTYRPALQSPAARDQPGWDIVDEQSWGSFPGSDSPSTWAGRDLPPGDEDPPRDPG